MIDAQPNKVDSGRHVEEYMTRAMKEMKTGKKSYVAALVVHLYLHYEEILMEELHTEVIVLQIKTPIVIDALDVDGRSRVDLYLAGKDELPSAQTSQIQKEEEASSAKEVVFSRTSTKKCRISGREQVSGKAEKTTLTLESREKEELNSTMDYNQTSTIVSEGQWSELKHTFEL